MTLTEKLDRAYRRGIVAFVSANDMLFPIRDRRDIHAEHGVIIVRFDRTWHTVPAELIKFVPRRIQS